MHELSISSYVAHSIAAFLSLSRRRAVGVVPLLHLAHQLCLDISAVQGQVPNRDEKKKDT